MPENILTLNPQIKIFPKYSNDASYCPLPSCKKLEIFNDRFPRKYLKIPNFRHLIPHSRIKIFFKIPAVSLFLLYWPLTSCKVSEKTNERFPRYLKTDTWTHGHTDMGDYNGPLWVNPGSKFENTNEQFLRYLKTDQ